MPHEGAGPSLLPSAAPGAPGPAGPALRLSASAGGLLSPPSAAQIVRALTMDGRAPPGAVRPPSRFGRRGSQAAAFGAAAGNL